MEGITGYNFNPITGYNNFLQGSASFDVHQDVKFDDILQNQIDGQTGAQAGAKISSNSAVGSLAHAIGNAFGNGLTAVNNDKIAANQAQETFAMGGDISVHELMIASEKSSLSMQMAMQLRNKLVSAYTDLKNINF